MLEWLENTQFSAWVRGELWGWPLALTLHALGTAVLVGFIVIIGLRLFGLFTMLPFPLLRQLFPVIWTALVLQFLSGFILWMAKPTQYVRDGAFVLKFSLVIAGIVLTKYFQDMLEREAPSWEANATISSRGIRLGGATLLLWCVVLIAGRLTAHLGSI